MAMNVTPFVGTDNFNMETFNNMISQINNGVNSEISGVNSEISEVLTQLGTKAKIQTGSYVGTGTYGPDNPCSLTFDFEPKLIFLQGNFSLVICTINSWVWGNYANAEKIDTSVTCTLSNKTLTWLTSYTSGDASDIIMNVKDKNYDYIAIA